VGKKLAVGDTNVIEMLQQELQTVEVTPFSAELAARTSELLDQPGMLGVGSLERLVRRLADRPDLWQPLVVVDRERRRYELLYEDDRVDIWVLSWMPGQRTGFHDHDISGVGLICVQGELDEGSLAIGSEAETVRMTPGVSRRGPGGYIHAVAHRAGEPAVSIHAYSPPLARVGQYRRDARGRLQREPEHGRKELFDATIGAAAAVTPSDG
jgi:predicted metal-dependent enzyme (double-stranded beta helix superfamily)